jgi:Ca-activated chloride channel family protein
MRRASVFCVLVILGISAGVFAQQQTTPPPPAQAPPSQQPLVSNVRLVDLLFTVVNKREKFITDLDQADFKVLEDNQPQQIRFFSRQSDLPLRVALLLDTSNSIRQRLKFEQDAATDFLYNVLRSNRDQAFLMTFDSEPEVDLDYTSDLDKLRNTINEQRAGGGTALYEAIIAASQKLANAPLPAGPNPSMRRVLVVISDGEDNLSRHTRADAIEAAERSGVVIYPISTSTEWISAEDTDDPSKRMNRKYLKSEGDEVLTAFANETGGRAFFPYHVEDVSESFLDIGTELRSQYSLAYSPINGIVDGKYRKIQIEVVGRKGLDVRTRKGYYAVPPIVTTLVPGEGQWNQEPF